MTHLSMQVSLPLADAMFVPVCSDCGLQLAEPVYGPYLKRTDVSEVQCPNGHMQRATWSLNKHIAILIAESPQR